MKKILYSFFTILLPCFTQILYAQPVPGTALEYIHGNRVRAAIPNKGDLFWDGLNASFDSNYGVLNANGEVPMSIYSAGLVLSGIDGAGNYYAAAGTYPNPDDLDFYPGPLDGNGEIDSSTSSHFDRVWKVGGADVIALIADWDDNGFINYPIPVSILAWPGRGNAFFAAQMGFNLPNQDLAPFHDRNFNNIYEPHYGEYPVADPAFPNRIAADLAWLVLNDAGPHTISNGAPMHVEAQVTVYAFAMPNDSIIDRTVFTRHKVINKGNILFGDFALGLWIDLELGCWLDDEMGCDVPSNTMYIYNADNNDELNCSTPGFGIGPPVTTISFLNQTLDNFIYYYRSDLGPIGGMGEPGNPQQHYRYMHGIWADGTPYTYGGIGYGDTTPIVTHVFPDNPNLPNGWSMLTGAPYTGSSNMFIGNTNITHFIPQQSVELLVAWTTHRYLGADHLANVDSALQNIPVLQQFVNTAIQQPAKPALTIAPNPANHQVMINYDIPAGFHWSIHNLTGQIIQSGFSTSSALIELSGISNGIYVLRAENNQGVECVKLVVAH